MAKNFHKYLKNEAGQNDGFRKKRGWTPKEEEEEELPKKILPFQKERLRRANALVYSQRKIRKEEKTIPVPQDIDLVRIHFFQVFNLDLQKKFLQRYGLNVIEYSNFNKSVIFEISKDEAFQVFVSHIQMVVDSADEDSYEGKPYNLMALVFNFEFINDKSRLGTTTESGFLISLISSSNQRIKEQKDFLLEYFKGIDGKVSIHAEYPELIEVDTLSKERVAEITKNFDVVRLITSSRSARVRPGVYGELRREFGFTVDVPEDLPTVGVIDTGVSVIDPLAPLITNVHYDHTGLGSNWDEIGHGTMVAGLIAFGQDFNLNVAASYTAKAKIAVIKVIHLSNDSIDIPKMLSDIKDARRTHGIRLFNFSLNLPIPKKYNEAISSFAYELDKLSHEEDILILMSVGNYNAEDLNSLLDGNYHPSHEYPQFFYDLASSSPHHSCWFTNIQEPSESMNNLSIGALAGNMEGNMNHDITVASEYPAYYSRKFHYDYTQSVNGTSLQRNQTNKFINKPDLIFEGGDLFKHSSGLEVLRSPLADGERYFGRSSGTSLSTPLVTSLAAEILHAYSTMRTQTVKALLINNADSIAGNNPPDFQGFEIDLYRKLIGFGKPLTDNLVYTDDNTAVFVIEDAVDLEDVLVVPLNLPKFVSENGNKLRFKATLCYSFLPVRDNHLNYLPLHISFGIFKNVSPESIANDEGPLYKIKQNITWSEDFHGIENRLFSNTQRLIFNLQPADLPALNHEIAVAVRCTAKKEISASHAEMLKNNHHRFSLVMSVTEIPENKASNELYNELMQINVVENIGEAEGLADVDLTV